MAGYSVDPKVVKASAATITTASGDMSTHIQAYQNIADSIIMHGWNSPAAVRARELSEKIVTTGKALNESLGYFGDATNKAAEAYAHHDETTRAALGI